MDISGEVEVNRTDSALTVRTAEYSRITFYDERTKEVKCFYGDSVSIIKQQPNEVSICVYRHNSIPYINKATDSPYIQNENISRDRTVEFPRVYIGSDVNELHSKGPVRIEKGVELNIKTHELHLSPEIHIQEDAKIKIVIE